MPAPAAAVRPRGAHVDIGSRRVDGRLLAQAERRSLAAHSIVALLIAALGLVVAASLSLTTNAQVPSGGGRATGATAGAPDPAGAADQPTRSAALQTALLREVAAQRSDRLVRSAEVIARSASQAGDAARQQSLNQTNRAAQVTAAKIAQERLLAAVAARQAAAQAAAQDGSAVGGTGTAPTPADPTRRTTSAPPTTRGVLPVPSGVVGAHFGQYGLWSRYHTGLDFRAAYGTPIRAVLPGVVLYAGSSGDWAGNHVAVKHADGKTTMYSHMSSMKATPGQSVQAGQVIGYVGQTGRAFGAHLHFELYPVGVRYGDVYRAVDPMPWLRAAGVQTR